MYRQSFILAICDGAARWQSMQRFAIRELTCCSWTQHTQSQITLTPHRYPLCVNTNSFSNASCPVSFQMQMAFLAEYKLSSYLTAVSQLNSAMPFQEF